MHFEGNSRFFSRQSTGGRDLNGLLEDVLRNQTCGLAVELQL